MAFSMSICLVGVSTMMKDSNKSSGDSLDSKVDKRSLVGVKDSAGEEPLWSNEDNKSTTHHPATTSLNHFLESSEYTGKRPGYIYLKGSMGTGYYLDRRCGRAIDENTTTAAATTTMHTSLKLIHNQTSVTGAKPAVSFRSGKKGIGLYLDPRRSTKLSQNSSPLPQLLEKKKNLHHVQTHQKEAKNGYVIATSHQNQKELFIPSDEFIGSKPGYMFQCGIHGLGYYVDLRSPDEVEGTSPTSNARNQKEHFVASSTYRGSKSGYIFQKGRLGIGYYRDPSDATDYDDNDVWECDLSVRTNPNENKASVLSSSTTSANGSMPTVVVQLTNRDNGYDLQPKSVVTALPQQDNYESSLLSRLSAGVKPMDVFQHRNKGIGYMHNTDSTSEHNEEVLHFEIPVSSRQQDTKMMQCLQQNGHHNPNHIYQTNSNSRQINECSSTFPISVTHTFPEQQKKAWFVASSQYVGSKPGYIFQNGRMGIGYYMDAKWPYEESSSLSNPIKSPSSFQPNQHEDTLFLNDYFGSAFHGIFQSDAESSIGLNPMNSFPQHEMMEQFLPWDNNVESNVGYNYENGGRHFGSYNHTAHSFTNNYDNNLSMEGEFRRQDRYYAGPLSVIYTENHCSDDPTAHLHSKTMASILLSSEGNQSKPGDRFQSGQKGIGYYDAVEQHTNEDNYVMAMPEVHTIIPSHGHSKNNPISTSKGLAGTKSVDSQPIVEVLSYLNTEY